MAPTLTATEADQRECQIFQLLNGRVPAETSTALSRVRTESELLLEPEADEHEAEHVGEQVDDAGVQPDASEQPPPLAPVHDLVPHERSQLLQSGGKKECVLRQ
jgi:hypothetical protein